MDKAEFSRTSKAMERTVIVIGATGGIGLPLYNKYLWHLCDVNNQDLKTVMGTSREAPGYLDVTMPETIEVFASLLEDDPNIQIINCVGINYNSVIEKSDYDKWRDVIEVNLIGSYNLLKAFTPIMKQQGYGRFMFMSSVAEKGLYGTSAYSASKAGLEGLVKSAAKELLKYNITVNALRLGYFNAGLISDVPKRVLEKEVYSSTVGQLCDPTNLYGLIEGVFGCEDITGSVISVDRGV